MASWLFTQQVIKQELNWTELNWIELNWIELNWTELQVTRVRTEETLNRSSDRAEDHSLRYFEIKRQDPTSQWLGHENPKRGNWLSAAERLRPYFSCGKGNTDTLAVGSPAIRLTRKSNRAFCVKPEVPLNNSNIPLIQTASKLCLPYKEDLVNSV
jgi:hypothetical protein